MLDLDKAAERLTQEQIRNCVNQTTLNYFGGMAKMTKQAHTEVVVSKLPPCDFCKQDPLVPYQVACYDGKTKMGPWANMCKEHFKAHGIGLGLGKGQKLILK